VSEGFFKPPAPVEDPEPRPPQPPWAGPPYGVLPGTVALEVILAGSERAAVYLGRCAAYPAGVELEVRVLLAPDAEELDPSLNGIYHRPGRSSSYESMLRFGIEFADGRRVSNVGGRGHGLDEPDGPVLWGMGGGGGGGRWHQDFWVWPLPPAGPLSFVCEWPAAEIALTRVDVDGQVLTEAAGRAREMFPDRGTSHGGGGGTWGGSWSSIGTAPVPHVRRTRGE
jgi:hypothetical protein